MGALTAAGGRVRRFNPLTAGRPGLRDHRKLIVCDGVTAIIGGANIATEYNGDGVRDGWRDLGLRLSPVLAAVLAGVFDEMWELAAGRHSRFAWLRRADRQRALVAGPATVLLGAPGWQRHPLGAALRADFARARTIQIISAYFLPGFGLLRELRRAARRGARVRLLLPALSDVPLMLLATRGLYRRLLTAGVEIYEYQPQILHAKLVVIDEAVAYAGSANLDIRSLHLNYELLVRVADPRLAREAAALFAHDLEHCRQWRLDEWVKLRTWWSRLKSRLAHAVFARLDPFLARGQIRRLRRGPPNHRHEPPQP